jgi:hypothetical protein
MTFPLDQEQDGLPRSERSDPILAGQTRGVKIPARRLKTDGE